MFAMFVPVVVIALTLTALFAFTCVVVAYPSPDREDLVWLYVLNPDDPVRDVTVF